MIQVDEIHDRIFRAMQFDTQDELIAFLADWQEINLDRELPHRDYLRLKREFEEELLEELIEPPEVKEELRGQVIRPYVRDLFRYIELDKHAHSYGTLLPRWTNLFKGISDIWFPLFYDFIEICLQKADDAGMNDVYFIARDAIPFWCIASSIRRRHRCHIHILPLTRQMVDSAKKEAARRTSESLTELLTRAGVASLSRAAIVDVGFYGSIVKDLWDIWLCKECKVYLFASRNPNIKGNLTPLFQVVNRDFERVRYQYLILYGDSIEALPKPYRSPRLESEVVADEAGRLSLFAAFSIYWNLAKQIETRSAVLSPGGAIRALSELHKRYWKRMAGKEVPFCLPERIHTSLRAEKLLKEWDIGPVPPLDIECGFRIP